MFLQSLTEHQVHILERIIAAVGLLLGFLALLTFLSRRRSGEKQKTPRRSEQLGQVEILTKDGWRTKANRKKRRR